MDSFIIIYAHIRNNWAWTYSYSHIKQHVHAQDKVWLYYIYTQRRKNQQSSQTSDEMVLPPGENKGVLVYALYPKDEESWTLQNWLRIHIFHLYRKEHKLLFRR